MSEVDKRPKTTNRAGVAGRKAGYLGTEYLIAFLKFIRKQMKNVMAAFPPVSKVFKCS